MKQTKEQKRIAELSNEISNLVYKLKMSENENRDLGEANIHLSEYKDFRKGVIDSTLKANSDLLRIIRWQINPKTAEKEVDNNKLIY